jgi:NADH:ubiquinone oxidoreductase subunit 6 (subunit J)
MLFGLAMATAIGGAAAAAFLPRLVPAAWSLALAALGTAGICLLLGADYVAILIALALGALLPSALIVAAVLAPPHQSDIRLSPLRRRAVTVLTVALFLVLTAVLAKMPWPAPGGASRSGYEWLGSRLLSHDLTLMLAAAALLGLAATGSVALLRPRARRR